MALLRPRVVLSPAKVAPERPAKLSVRADTRRAAEKLMSFAFECRTHRVPLVVQTILTPDNRFEQIGPIVRGMGAEWTVVPGSGGGVSVAEFLMLNDNES